MDIGIRQRVACMPFTVIFLTAGLFSISPVVYEAARIDGATKIKSFLYNAPTIETIYHYKSYSYNNVVSEFL